jgi:serine/threonine protein kinase
MTPERWQQVKGVLENVLERAPSERAVFLVQACDGDQALRREVESLLASDEQGRSSFLQSPPSLKLVRGTRLGDYEIQSLLGAGGMGEVYRARDLRLRRDVAIKVLPAFVASDPERLRRFEQEATAAAALNHPNILAVHQMGTYDGAPYLVSELLEGETLREQMKRRPMAVRRAMDYGIQVARGLAVAHEKGIVHRDLKPENLFVPKDGRVKILDFGLAKLTRPQHGSEHSSPTLGAETEAGVVMGTVGYMAPEQVRGQAADHRADIFAFGAILYEMLAGKRAFQKPTSPETLTAILNEDPPGISQVVPNLPPALQRVVHRCLEKNPEQRFQSASDLAFALEALSDSGSSSTVPVEAARRRVWRPWLRVAAEVALLGIALTIFFALHTSENPGPQLQAAILPPPGEGFWANLTQPAAVSPDGKFLAIIAMRNGQTQLWLRRLDASEAQPIAGGEGATSPFWSPDSRYIGFFASGKLKKVDISGGKVSDICPVGTFSLGGSWSPRGVIVFSTFADALKRVSDGGGTPEPISGIALSSDALGQYWPVFLPDGNHILYLEWRYASHESHDNSIWIGSLDGKNKSRRLPLPSTNVQYSAGYLLFSRDGDLFAQKFDLAHLELRGPALPVARNIQYNTFFDDASFTASTNGILVYGAAGTGVNSELTWMDRNGNALGVLGEPGQFELQSVSPDTKRVAVGVKPSGPRENIWIYDVDRGTRVPLDPDGSGPALYGPCWSPDGKQVAYRSTLGKTSGLYVRASDGSGQEKQIGGRYDGVVTAEDWSPDGRYLAVTWAKFLGAQNWHSTLQVLRVAGEVKTEFEIDNAQNGRFSRDGRWLAYSDDASGEVYVTPFPGPGGRIAVSSAGGGGPRWRGDGREFFYVADDQTLISVQIRESPQEFRVLSSRPLFRLPLPNNVGFYDITPDGKRFLVNTRTHKEQAAPLTVVTNWSAQFQNESRSEVPKN